MNRWLLGIVALAVVLLVVGTAVGIGRPAARPPSSAAAATGSGAAAASFVVAPGASSVATAALGSPPVAGALEPLASLLAMLRIAPEDRTGYQRSLFVHWIDADGNGCDTRHEVLIRDAIVKPTVGARCALSGGAWLSLYDGRTFTDPAQLQIDHVIPLAEAWDSGAAAWTPARREAFANDLGVDFTLLAVSAATNESKSDADPADWLPPAAAAECPYLGDWLAAKVRWDLAVDEREHDAIAADLAACPGTAMPYDPAGSEGVP